VYVPVNDAAVTLNTGILVYKECILRPLQDRLRESATSALLKKNIIGIETGREGNKRYVVNRPAERREVWGKSKLTTLTGPIADAVTPAFKSVVVRWDAQTYRQEMGVPESMLTCPYDDIDARINNQSDDSIGSILALTNPACIPHIDALMFKDLGDASAAQAVADWETMLAAGRDFYAATDNASDPLAERILTPASVVQESFQQVLGSPVRQLESANDIGQMIGALFAGVTTQITTDNRGLAGLSQSVAGQPSYLEQVARESSQGVIGAAVNAALAILNSSRQIEASYLASMNAIASALTQTINQLRSTENQCWNLIIPKAQAYAAQGTCTTDPLTGQQTCTGGFQLDSTKIRTSTSSMAFSQQVINSQVAPLATTTVSNVQASQRALGLIDQLITSVTNTASLTAQRLALQQLDSLVAQKALHTQYDAQNAAKQRDDVVGAMTTLVEDTAKAWGDSPDPSVGWCNINNSGVIQAWAGRWKK